jgi:hypothetical protein
MKISDYVFTRPYSCEPFSYLRKNLLLHAWLEDAQPFGREILFLRLTIFSKIDFTCNQTVFYLSSYEKPVFYYETVDF